MFITNIFIWNARMECQKFDKCTKAMVYLENNITPDTLFLDFEKIFGCLFSQWKYIEISPTYIWFTEIVTLLLGTANLGIDEF